MKIRRKTQSLFCDFCEKSVLKEALFLLFQQFFHTKKHVAASVQRAF